MNNIDFTPYNRFIVCSNELLNVKYILSANNTYPILIGQSSCGHPLIWISNITNSEYIIYKNLATHPNFRVQHDIDNHIVNIEYTYSGAATWEKVMSINYTDTNSPNIYYMDLRPLGYTIHGNEYELHIGHSGIVKNATYRNSDAFIGF